MRLRLSPFFPALLVLGVLLGPAPGAQGTPVDFGDAPDGAAACEGAGTLDPASYPTIFGTLNAFPGRTAPYHFPLADPNEDYFFSAAPTYEDAAFQPTCDWITPPCDFDGGPSILCLNAACTTGVFVVPGGPCHDLAAALFGTTPGPIGYWIYEVNRGPFSMQAGFVNVAVDFGLDGQYGDVPGEWVVRDEVVDVLPWQTQVEVTGPFPVPTVHACGNVLGWCIDPFWSRFHLSDEEMGLTFDGVTTVWDGSGKLGGYAGGVTVDIVPESDPQFLLEEPRQYCGMPEGSVTISLDPGDVGCRSGHTVPLVAGGTGRLRAFGPGIRTGMPVPIELLQLELVGFQAPLGQVNLSERADRMSLGKIDNVVASNGQLIAGDSFFDVFWTIELPDLGLTLDTGSRAGRVDGHIQQLPPVGSPYRTPTGAQSVPLYRQGSSVQVGWLCAAELTFVQKDICPRNKVKRR